MSYGLQQAGIQVLAGIDNSPQCRETYVANISDAKYIKHDISTLSAPELGRRVGIERDDPNLVFAGCSPCQFWSKIRTDKTRSAHTAHLLKQFQKLSGTSGRALLLSKTSQDFIAAKTKVYFPISCVSWPERITSGTTASLMPTTMVFHRTEFDICCWRHDCRTASTCRLPTKLRA